MYLFDDYLEKCNEKIISSSLEHCKEIQRSYIEDKIYCTMHVIQNFLNEYCSVLMLYNDIYHLFILNNKQKLLNDLNNCEFEDIDDEINLISDKKFEIKNLEKYHAYIIAEHSFENKYIIKIGFYHYPIHYSLEKDLFYELNENTIKYGLIGMPDKPIYLSFNKGAKILNPFYHYYDINGLPFIINLESADIFYDTPFKFHFSGTSEI